MVGIADDFSGVSQGESLTNDGNWGYNNTNDLVGATGGGKITNPVAGMYHDNFYYYSSSTLNTASDCRVELTLDSKGTASVEVIYVRARAATGGYDCYAFGPNMGDGRYELKKWPGNTVLRTLAATPAAGHRFRIEVSSAHVISAWVATNGVDFNDAITPYDDSSSPLTNTGYVGIAWYYSNNTASVIDNFSATDVLISGAVLTADDIESLSEVSSPAIGQVHALLADDVESSSEVSAPSIAQTHALLADDVESSSEVSAPAIGLMYAVTADDVESASEVSSPAIGQVHALLADDVESNSEVSSPAVGQEHALLAEDVEASSEVSLPTIGQSNTLLADDVESVSEVSAPAIGQVHALLADDAESASEISAPAIEQTHALLAEDVESAAEVSAPVLVENAPNVDNLLADDVESVSEVSSPVVGQIHVITADDVESASELSAPALGEISAVNDLLADDIESTSEVSAPVISQGHALLANDVEARSELSIPSLDAEIIIVTPVGGFLKKHSHDYYKKRYAAFKRQRDNDYRVEQEFIRALLGKKKITIPNFTKEKDLSNMRIVISDANDRIEIEKIETVTGFKLPVIRNKRAGKPITIDVIKQDDEEIIRLLEGLI